MGADVAAQFRQFIHLDRKRAQGGLRPSELRRWMKLKRLLNQQFAPGTSFEKADRRSSVRVPTSCRVTFASSEELESSLMTNLSRGGLFVETTRPREIGTIVELRIQVEETDEEIVVPGRVVSVDARPDAPGSHRGMGVTFVDPKPEEERKIAELYERKLREAAASVAGSDPERDPD